jgi:hypothetical protein
MGRNKKYITEEEKVLAQREYVRRYYNKNKEKLDGKAKENYYKRKERADR